MASEWLLGLPVNQEVKSAMKGFIHTEQIINSLPGYGGTILALERKRQANL